MNVSSAPSSTKSGAPGGSRPVRHFRGRSFAGQPCGGESPVPRSSPVRDVIRSLVEEIEPYDGVEADHRLDALAWIDVADEIFRTAKPATPPKHLVSYCVLVDSEAGQVFLVDHRDATRWLPTGGHVEADENPVDTATREIFEELRIEPGFHKAVGPRPLMVTVTRTQGQSEPHVDVSLWFVFDGSDRAAVTPDETEFVEARWWSFDEVGGDGPVEFDPHLPRFIDKLRHQLVA
jgi:8-oxo-dGTP diphosphatase